MKYQKPSSVSGKWVNKKELHESGADRGVSCKIVSETKPEERTFNGVASTQDVTKVRFESVEEPVNVALNKPTIGALIEAFGDDSKDWMGKPLTAMTEKTLISGKRGYALYLVPQGFELSEDTGGYVVIVKQGEKVEVVSEEDIVALP